MRTLSLAVLFLLSCAVVSNAEIILLKKDKIDLLTLDINSRVRYEIESLDFDDNTGATDYGHHRVMLGFFIHPDNNIKARFKFKETRVYGTQKSNSSPSANLELQEASVRTENILGRNIAVQIGRFEQYYGRKRIMGNGDWNPYGTRTYDGIRIDYSGNNFDLKLGVFKIFDFNYSSEINDILGTNYNTERADRNLFILAANIKNGLIQPLFMADINNSHQQNTKSSPIFTSGIYLNPSFHNFVFNIDAAYQTGRQNDRDLSSWMAAFDLKYKFKTALKPFIGAGFDITSGNAYNEDSATDDDHVFYAPFMSRHRFRGFMDYFRDVRRGLNDTYLNAGLTLAGKANISLDVHHFEYMEDEQKLSGANLETYTTLCDEVDLRVRFPLNEYIWLDAAHCLSLPGNGWQPNDTFSQFTYVTFCFIL